MHEPKCRVHIWILKTCMRMRFLKIKIGNGNCGKPSLDIEIRRITKINRRINEWLERDVVVGVGQRWPCKNIKSAALSKEPLGLLRKLLGCLHMLLKIMKSLVCSISFMMALSKPSPWLALRPMIYTSWHPCLGKF